MATKKKAAPVTANVPPKPAAPKKARPKKAKTAVKQRRAMNAAKALDSKPKARLEIYKLAQEPSQEKYFILANGRPVKHVAELASILHEIEDRVFSHHVNPERNDFASWVKDVFKDVELAKKMLGVDNKHHLQLVIYKHAAQKAFEHKDW